MTPLPAPYVVANIVARFKRCRLSLGPVRLRTKKPSRRFIRKIRRWAVHPPQANPVDWTNWHRPLAAPRILGELQLQPNRLRVNKLESRQLKKRFAGGRRSCQYSSVLDCCC